MDVGFLQEDVLNTDLFAALYIGVVATLFALKTESVGDVVEMKWRRFATVMCAVISVFLLVRIATTTVLYFAVVLGH